ncbi:hypothetical protein GCM10010388_70700 [Streptomyces mauvecolor]
MVLPLAGFEDLAAGRPEPLRAPELEPEPEREPVPAPEPAPERLLVMRVIRNLPSWDKTAQAGTRT